MKQFSKARNTQSDSQSSVEKRRCRKEIEMTRRRKGRVKREEGSQANNEWILKIRFLKVKKLIKNTKKQRG